MITIRKISGLVILTAFFLFPVFAETAKRNYGFSLSPEIGILYGRSEELVYNDPPRQDLYLSELLWDLKPLLYAGFGADFRPADLSRKQGFAAALSFKAGLPIKTGILENRDWLNPDEDYLTHYSRHDAYSRTAILLDISAGYFRRFAGSLAFGAYAELSYMHFSWSAKDGYIQYPSSWSIPYPPWSNTLGKESTPGELIRYSQNWFIFSPGISLDWDINHLFSLKAHFNYSPLIYCADRDEHLLTEKTFLDYLYFGRYIKAGGEFTLSLSQNTGIFLSASYKNISGARGDTIHQKRRYKDEAGAAFSALDLGLGIKFRL